MDKEEEPHMSLAIREWIALPISQEITRRKIKRDLTGCMERQKSFPDSEVASNRMKTLCKALHTM